MVPALSIFGLGLQLVVLTNHLAVCEASIYPGLRRKPSHQSAQQQFAISADFLAQMMEDNARRKLQQQFEQQLELINRQQQQHTGGPNHCSYDNQNGLDGADFTYKFSPNTDAIQNEDRIPFAVDPSDLRFYEDLPKLDDDGFHEIEEQPDRAVTPAEPKPNNEVIYHRVKPPIHLNPMTPVQNAAAGGRVRDDLNALLEKLEKDGKADAIVNSQNMGHDEHVILRQHMGIEGEMGMYVVALIAGVSAAVTVGLIALGIAWYTLQKKTKAAADVEYPAYGITGPNKDLSPSGDRRLVQSAQMYNYQHQKQQIIAMENRQPGEGHGGLWDVESDDDNEEGVYTVYECPGLAPTGEMEVKNPLFVNDTPVTPSTAGTTVSNQQPQTQSPQKQPPRKPPKTPPSTNTGKPSSASSTGTTSAIAPASAQPDEKKDGEK